MTRERERERERKREREGERENEIKINKNKTQNKKNILNKPTISAQPEREQPPQQQNLITSTKRKETEI